MWFKPYQKNKERFNNRLIILLAVVKLVVPYLLQSAVYEPHRDEFLYLAEGQHLAWGYLEIPPFLSLFAWINQFLGNSIFWIKFWPAIMGSLTFIITAKIVQSLGGRSFAVFLVFLPFVFGAFLRIFFLFQPNAPEVFFYTLMAYGIIRFIQTQKNRWIYIFGIAAGLGMLSKYSIAFFIASLLLGFLITRQRKIFTNKHFYFAGIIGALIFLPNLLWQYQHNFPVLFHMQELKETQLKYLDPISFLLDQLLMNLPAFFVWFAGLYFVAFSFKGRNYRLFAWTYIFLLAFLLFFQGKSYYALGIYPVLFAFGAYHLERFAEGRSKAWKYILIGVPVILGILILPVSLPLAKPAALAAHYESRGLEKYGILKWEDQKNHSLPQDFADMLGWKEMAEKVSKAYATLNDQEKKATIIFGGNYGQAGAINFYGEKYGLPESYSENASFLLWLPPIDTIRNIILVTDDKNEMQRPYIKMFSSAVVYDSIENIYAREYGSLIIILKGPSKDVIEMLKKEIKAKKDQFTRQ